MIGQLRATALAGSLLVALSSGEMACAQKAGGILRMFTVDSPASMSIHEEATIIAERPMMGVFNNLVMFDQHARQSSLDTIEPDLATGWAWNEDGTELTFPLRRGVRWHDGETFTAKDVKCTWDMLAGNSREKFRVNPRKGWYRNLEQVTTNGDYEVTFRLKQPQPAFLTTLASGYSPIYPCHVPARDMRQHPIGTGPFKFVEFKPNERITVTRNPDYWKNGRPYLDGIEYTIIKNRATAILGFISGKFDMTFPYQVTIPLLRDVQSQMPQAICELRPNNVRSALLVNHEAPPFDNPHLRRALALTLDRKGFIDILGEGQFTIGAVMMPPPEGLWGMPPDMLRALPGYDPDVQKNRAEARTLMEKLGYGPDRRLPVKIVIRDVPEFRDNAVILIDQLKQIYIDGELDPIDTVNFFPKIFRKDYQVSIGLQAGEIDEPDEEFYGRYACGAQLNLTGYCNRELEQRFDRQSMEPDQEKRKQLVWEIDKKLQEDGARPIIAHYRQATCWQPRVKGLTMMVSSIFNGWRMEDVWLDQ